VQSLKICKKNIEHAFHALMRDVCLTTVAYIRPAGMVRIGSSGPARPAWLKAANARFRCEGREHIVAASRTAYCY